MDSLDALVRWMTTPDDHPACPRHRRAGTPWVNDLRRGSDVTGFSLDVAVRRDRAGDRMIARAVCRLRLACSRLPDGEGGAGNGPPRNTHSFDTETL